MSKHIEIRIAVVGYSDVVYILSPNVYIYL